MHDENLQAAVEMAWRTTSQARLWEGGTRLLQRTCTQLPGRVTICNGAARCGADSPRERNHEKSNRRVLRCSGCCFVCTGTFRWHRQQRVSWRFTALPLPLKLSLKVDGCGSEPRPSPVARTAPPPTGGRQPTKLNQTRLRFLRQTFRQRAVPDGTLQRQ